MKISNSFLLQILKNMDWQTAKVYDFDSDNGVGIAEKYSELHDPKNDIFLDFDVRIVGEWYHEDDINVHDLKNVNIDVERFQMVTSESVEINLTKEQEETIIDWIESYSY